MIETRASPAEWDGFEDRPASLGTIQNLPPLVNTFSAVADFATVPARVPAQLYSMPELIFTTKLPKYLLRLVYNCIYLYIPAQRGRNKRETEMTGWISNDEETAKKLRNSGMTFRAIAKQLNTSHSRVQSWVKW